MRLTFGRVACMLSALVLPFTIAVLVVTCVSLGRIETVVDHTSRFGQTGRCGPQRSFYNSALLPTDLKLMLERDVLAPDGCNQCANRNLRAIWLAPGDLCTLKGDKKLLDAHTSFQHCTTVYQNDYDSDHHVKACVSMADLDELWKTDHCHSSASGIAPYFDSMTEGLLFCASDLWCYQCEGGPLLREPFCGYKVKFTYVRCSHPPPAPLAPPALPPPPYPPMKCSDVFNEDVGDNDLLSCDGRLFRGSELNKSLAQPYCDSYNDYCAQYVPQKYKGDGCRLKICSRAT